MIAADSLPPAAAQFAGKQPLRRLAELLPPSTARARRKRGRIRRKTRDTKWDSDPQILLDFLQRFKEKNEVKNMVVCGWESEIEVCGCCGGRK